MSTPIKKVWIVNQEGIIKGVWMCKKYALEWMKNEHLAKVHGENTWRTTKKTKTKLSYLEKHLVIPKRTTRKYEKKERP